MNKEFYEERIEKTKEMIVAYEEAVLFLVANPTRSYTFETGQSQQEVTRFDIDKLRESITSLLSLLEYYNDQISNSVTLNVPAW